MRTVLITFSVALLLASCGDDPAPTATAPPVPGWAKVAPEQIAEAEKHGVPVAFENDLGMRFVLIPAGTFLMGSPEDEEGRNDSETQHEVTLTKPYYMQITEVTNGQFLEFAKHLPSMDEFAGDSRPVNYISYYTAKGLVKRLNERDTSRLYGLPTEAQWEWACRAGRTTAFHTGATLRKSQANFDDEEGTTVVGASYDPSGWGLYDMHGNVLEWCRDWFAPYPTAHANDPVGPESGDMRVLRGGSWVHELKHTRSAARHQTIPNDEYHVAGLRLVSPLPEPGERGR